MRSLFMLMCVLLLAGCAASDLKIPEFEQRAIMELLSDEQEVAVSISEVAKHRTDAICVAGSYAFDLPGNLRMAQAALTERGLLPVEEGKGLVFTVSRGDLAGAQIYSVWHGDLVLDPPGSPQCYDFEAARLIIQRTGEGSVRFSVR